MQSSTLNAFLEAQKAAFVKRGTLFMVDVINDAINSDCDSFCDLIEAERRLMIECGDSSNVDFMYHWSVLTYWQSLSDEFERKVKIGVDTDAK